MALSAAKNVGVSCVTVLVYLPFLRTHSFLPVGFGDLPAVDGVAGKSSPSFCSDLGLSSTCWLDLLLESAFNFCRLALQKHDAIDICKM